MENASKALIMAAEVLVGVMILSIGIYLFNIFGSYSSETTRRIDQAQIDEFNEQFLKYYGTNKDSSGKDQPIKCTIHDITSLANLANRNNIENEVSDYDGYSNSSVYIQVDIDRKTNIEKYTNEELVNLIKTNDLVDSYDEIGNPVKKTKYYKCVICQIDESTKYVNYIKFVEI